MIFYDTEDKDQSTILFRFSSVLIVYCKLTPVLNSKFVDVCAFYSYVQWFQEEAIL
jgi:hypothetical protein